MWGMVDVAEGERGGENQATTHNRARVERMGEVGFTARERLNRIRENPGEKLEGPWNILFNFNHVVRNS